MKCKVSFVLFLCILLPKVKTWKAEAEFSHKKLLKFQAVTSAIQKWCAPVRCSRRQRGGNAPPPRIQFARSGASFNDPLRKNSSSAACPTPLKKLDFNFQGRDTFCNTVFLPFNAQIGMKLGYSELLKMQACLFQLWEWVMYVCGILWIVWCQWISYDNRYPL